MKPEDLKDMKYNPLVRTKGLNIWEIYPDLATRKDFCEIPMGVFGKTPDDLPTKGDLDEVVRWVILFCTKDGNPLARELDFEARRKRCFDELYMKPGYLSVKLITQWHPFVVNIMAVYMRMIDNEKYSRWIAMKASHDQNLQYLMANPIFADDPEKMLALKDKLAKSLPKSAKDLKELEASLFPDEQVRDVLNEFQTLISDGPGGWAEYYVAQNYDETMKKLTGRG